MTDNGSRFSILMVDDDQEDVYSMRRAIQEADDSVVFEAVSSGEDFFDRLEGRGPEAKPPSDPDLILLDLNLPVISGHDVLKSFRSHKRLGLTPVIILTTSDIESDAGRCYKLGANVVFTKATSFAATIKIAQAILSFWQTTGIIRTK